MDRTLSKEYQDSWVSADAFDRSVGRQVRTVQSFAAEDREQTRYQDKIGNPDEFPYQA
jgi:hypothetical protein